MNKLYISCTCMINCTGKYEKIAQNVDKKTIHTNCMEKSVIPNTPRAKSNEFDSSQALMWTAWGRFFAWGLITKWLNTWRFRPRIHVSSSFIHWNVSSLRQFDYANQSNSSFHRNSYWNTISYHFLNVNAKQLSKSKIRKTRKIHWISGMFAFG